MQKVKHVKLNDYVLLSRWADKGFHDPWAVGFISEYGVDMRGRWYRVGTTQHRYRHCWKITSAEGRQRFEDARKLGDEPNESFVYASEGNKQ